MKLIVLLICLGLERYASVGLYLSRLKLLRIYLDKLFAMAPNKELQQGWLGVIYAILPLVLIVGFVYWLTSSWVFGAFGLVISIVVLLYCLGPDDLYHQLSTYFQLDPKKDAEQRDALLAELIDGDVPTDDKEANRALTKAIFVQANERFFGVVFWFIVLGPVGAIVYRMSVLLRRLGRKEDSVCSAFHAEVTFFQNILDWIPARISALMYLLVGDFSQSFPLWIQYLPAGLSDSRELLKNCGLGAMAIDPEMGTMAFPEENRIALELVDRALIIVLVLIAIFTLGAWIY